MKVEVGQHIAEVVGTVAIVCFVVFAVGVIIFNIWTIFVAKNAIKEIKYEQFSSTDEHFGLF